MPRRLAFFSCLIATASATVACGQTIQLPTFNFFTVSTTVSVPDSGGAFLGGVNSVSSGRTSGGLPLVGGLPVAGRPFGNIGMAGTSIGGGVSVHATIHDFDAMDQLILGNGLTGLTLSRDPLVAKFAAPPVTHPAPVASIAAIRREQAAKAAAVEQELRDLVAKGRKAEEAGKPGLAKIYYQMAARRATGELLAEISARLAGLDQAKQPRRVAASGR